VKNEEENVFAPMPDPFRRGVNCSKDQKKKKKKKKKKILGVFKKFRKKTDGVC
jgi:hypothetical protein